MPSRNRTTRMPFFRRGQGGGLPLAADLRQEVVAGRAVFVEQFVSAVSIKADGRGGHQGGRRPGEFGQSVAQQGRSPNTAVTDPGLLRRRPTPGGDVLARQVHDRIQAFKPTAVQLSGLGIPLNRRLPWT